MADDNIKTISQRTGEFIEEGAEPGFQVNMDDPGAQAFIDRVKGVPGGSEGAPVRSVISTTPIAQPEVPQTVTEQPVQSTTVSESVASVVASPPPRSVTRTRR